jgi:hypothetical protein
MFVELKALNYALFPRSISLCFSCIFVEETVVQRELD